MTSASHQSEVCATCIMVPCACEDIPPVRWEETGPCAAELMSAAEALRMVQARAERAAGFGCRLLIHPSLWIKAGLGNPHDLHRASVVVESGDRVSLLFGDWDMDRLCQEVPG